MSLVKNVSPFFALALVLTIATGCTTFNSETTASGVKVKTHKFHEIEFVWIPPGTFQMGSPVEQAGCDADEAPLHNVTFEKGFWISRREITEKQYALAMGVSPPADKREEKPATNVSWLDAMAFCAKLSEDSGACYRLPTEAQWEYAARAGAATAYHYGCDPVLLEIYDWYAVNTPDKSAQYPGQRAPNRWGLYDVHGNVSEWCYDFYAEDYYEQSCPTAPMGPEKAAARVVRGGSVTSKAVECRIANRSYAAPEAKSPTMGFRIVRDKLPTWPKFYSCAKKK